MSRIGFHSEAVLPEIDDGPKDRDGDGVINVEDNCPTLANTDQVNKMTMS